jgi:hypothetical protein
MPMLLAWKLRSEGERASACGDLPLARRVSIAPYWRRLIGLIINGIFVFVKMLPIFASERAFVTSDFGASTYSAARFSAAPFSRV